MGKTQIIIWESPNIYENEHSLDCELALFKTWDGDIYLGQYDSGSDCFETESNSYFIYNDVEMYAIITKSN